MARRVPTRATSSGDLFIRSFLAFLSPCQAANRYRDFTILVHCYFFDVLDGAGKAATLSSPLLLAERICQILGWESGG